MGAKYDIEFCFFYFRGYLQALEKIAGDNFTFSASYFNTGSDLDSSLAAHFLEWGNEYQYRERALIPYSRVQEILRTCIYSKLSGLEESTVARIDRYLQEHYGLIGSCVDPGGAFHPLVNGPVFELGVEYPSDKCCTYFLVQVGDVSIVTQLCTNAA